MSQKTDNQITEDVIAELAWDPAVSVADLSISTEQGRVKLNGTADTYGTRVEAEDAAYRVGGVRFVDNEIVVNPVALGVRADVNIAASSNRTKHGSYAHAPFPYVVGVGHMLRISRVQTFSSNNLVGGKRQVKKY